MFCLEYNRSVMVMEIIHVKPIVYYAFTKYVTSEKSEYGSEEEIKKE